MCILLRTVGEGNTFESPPHTSAEILLTRLCLPPSSRLLLPYHNAPTTLQHHSSPAKIPPPTKIPVPSNRAHQRDCLSLPSGQSCTNPRPPSGQGPSHPINTPTPIVAPPFPFPPSPKKKLIDQPPKRPHRGLRSRSLSKGNKIFQPRFQYHGSSVLCAPCRSPLGAFSLRCNLATSVALDATLLHVFALPVLETPWHATWNQSNQSRFGWSIFGLKSRVWELAMPGVWVTVYGVLCPCLSNI